LRCGLLRDIIDVEGSRDCGRLIQDYDPNLRRIPMGDKDVLNDQDLELYRQLEQELRASFEQQLPYQMVRASRVRALNMRPGHYFVRAAFECKNMFVAGCYVGCVSLCQSVAEALARFICTVKHVSGGRTVLEKAAKLQKNGVISPEIREAFRTISAHDRNIFHHLDENVETDNKLLGARAEQCVNALYRIESELFAYTIDGRSIIPKYPEYWFSKGLLDRGAGALEIVD
jgi:hypothetical protein